MTATPNEATERSAVGRFTPTIALHLTEIERLWDKRPIIVARKEAASDRHEGSLARKDPQPESTALEKAYESLYAELWDLDNEIMATPVATAHDLVLKARIVQLRKDDEGFHDDYVERLAADVVAFFAAVQ